MHPQFGQTPPRSRFSITATEAGLARFDAVHLSADDPVLCVGGQHLLGLRVGHQKHGLGGICLAPGGRELTAVKASAAWLHHNALLSDYTRQTQHEAARPGRRNPMGEVA
ncbi:MAG TPA: hypothetical protein VGI22_13505 [Xanthobacteraceae bacterium]|jgi:hypothetical protein